MKNCGISQKTFNLIFGHPVTPKRKCPGQARAFRFGAGATPSFHYGGQAGWRMKNCGMS